MLKTVHDTAFDFLWQSSAEKRIRSQEAAVRLLFEKHQDVLTAHQSLGSDSLFKKIKGAVSDATHIFPLSDVQKEIYYSDTGSAVVPPFLKKKLLDLKGRFVVRPATLSDLQAFMQFAHREKVRYTIRAAGSWPFGGSIPMNNELVLDLSYLDFHALDAEQETLVVGPGAVFAKMRTFLKERRFALCQEITNPNSGTICGWVVTGGLGILRSWVRSNTCIPWPLASETINA